MPSTSKGQGEETPALPCSILITAVEGLTLAHPLLTAVPDPAAANPNQSVPKSQAGEKKASPAPGMWNQSIP